MNAFKCDICEKEMGRWYRVNINPMAMYDEMNVSHMVRHKSIKDICEKCFEKLKSNCQNFRTDKGENMITASEAKAKTEAARNDDISREMERIEREIEQAICKGDNNIALDGAIKRETAEHLRSLGYEVHVGSQYNESYFTIKW